MWPKNLIAVNYTRPERLKFLASLLYLWWNILVLYRPISKSTEYNYDITYLQSQFLVVWTNRLKIKIQVIAAYLLKILPAVIWIVVFTFNHKY